MEMVGRNAEREHLAHLLRGHRLVTVTGPAGSGKTCLALAVAADAMQDYPGGIVFVDLAHVRQSRKVREVVGTTLRSVGVTVDHGSPAAAAAGHRIGALPQLRRDAPVLLVLDTCEYVVAGVSLLAEALLTTYPNLRILTTSRQPLGVQTEIAFPVPGLSRQIAVNLFVTFATCVQPRFAPTDDQIATIDRVCALLDDLPLGVDLASRQISVLTLTELESRLQAGADIAIGDRARPARHRALSAAAAWSDALLGPSERDLCYRLAVFAPDASREAIIAVTVDGVDSMRSKDQRGTIFGSELDLQPLLDRLVATSVVIATSDSNGHNRYRLAAPMRLYAARQLLTAGMLEEVQERRAAYYLHMVEEAKPQLRGPAQASWVRRLDAELENIRAVLKWAQITQAREVALRLASALWPYWEISGRAMEGLDWLETALSVRGQVASEVNAEALNAAGNLARVCGRYARAEELHAACLALRRRAGDRAGVVGSLNNLALVARDHGDEMRAAELQRRCVAAARAAGDSRLTALACLNLGRMARRRGDCTAAERALDEAIALYRNRGDQQGTAATLNALADVAIDRRETKAARVFYDEALALHEGVGDTWGAALSRLGLARVMLAEGELLDAASRCVSALTMLHSVGVPRDVAAALEVASEIACAQADASTAVTLAGVANALRQATGAARAPVDEGAYAQLLGRLQSVLEGQTFAAAWRVGQATSVETAISLAAACERVTVEAAGFEARLTTRERQVLQLAAEGRASKEIARTLLVSVRTVEHHFSSIYRKTGARSRAAAVAQALRAT
jgi:predicted ATPase/DNA-binding NarL/FixJ family response regulator